MRIVVLGAGAMGSVVGGFLAMDGHDVTLIGRQAHMEAIAENGLHITGIWDEHVVHGLGVATEPSQLPGGIVHLLLVTVKSFDTAAAIRLAEPLVGDKTLVCAYQNGLGNAETIAEVVGWERTIGARAIFGTRIIEPGHVDVTVIANPTALGSYAIGPDPDRIRQIVVTMDGAGLRTVYSDRIATVLWNKVAYNCALNPLSALLDLSYGGVYANPHNHATMTAVVRELFAVAEARGVVMDPATPEAYMDHLYYDLIPPTQRHYASMRADMLHERRTEIDSLNGAIARYGEALGIPCPVNATLTRLIHAREREYGIDVERA